MQTNNRISLRGRLAAPPVPSHSNHGVDYFTFHLAVRRLSGAEDRLNVVASQEQLALFPPLEAGDPLSVTGEVRTFNNRSGVGSRLVVSVFARELSQEEGEMFLGLLKKALSGLQPALWPGRLSALHRLGQPGLPLRVHGGGGPPGPGGAAAKPGVHQRN